ncbi:MAG TPA: hypothetical protein VEC75_11780 [Stellaceae bacterium]|nr:hypothetical protein [Stellaceae bacterium]HYC14924.1 hypothetical protein [Stellaceae bacterium]
MARPQRSGVGGNSAGGESASERSRRKTIPAPANDNRIRLERLGLRLLMALGAAALLGILLRYALG